MKLICTADDFGIGYETSRGIVHAHLHGPVTCTSLMTVTGDHARRSMPLLDGAPGLELGLHLVMSGGDKPLAATSASGLLDRDGRFLPLPRLILRAYFGRLDRAGVYDEVCAQAEMCHTLLGRRPAYVDGHHHAHQLPTIRDAVLQAINQGVLPRVTRSTVEAPAMKAVKTAGVRRRVARFLGRTGGRFYRDRAVATNDSFFGMLDDADLNKPLPWADYLSRLPIDGVVEWVVHPGFEDPTLTGRDSYVPQRVLEVKTLTHPDNRSAWEREGIERVTKSALQPVAV
jgi:predicted glycoside hydrolase/deacetylase ChbG (UPF0249 family)